MNKTRNRSVVLDPATIKHYAKEKRLHTIESFELAFLMFLNLPPEQSSSTPINAWNGKKMAKEKARLLADFFGFNGDYCLLQASQPSKWLELLSTYRVETSFCELQSTNKMITNPMIEDYHAAKVFDSAVSLNSYYTWPEPEKVLSHIYSLLKPGGIFALATPNTRLDMFAMEKQVRKELLTHPDYDTFRQINLELSSNDNAQFIAMNDLVRQVLHIGFVLTSCHQSFYLGGLNFVVLQKPSAVLKAA